MAVKERYVFNLNNRINASFTLDVCVCVKVNTSSMVTQMQMQRMGLNPFAASTFALLLTQC